MKFKHLRIDQSNLSGWQNQLADLEVCFTYPFGDDEFKIDHGQNYLAFFENFGKPHYYAMTYKGQIIAVAAAVLHQRLRAWYLCDLKVHPDFRGKSLTRKMFLRHFIPCYFKCQRGFSLVMQSDFGPQNSVMKIIKTLPLTPLKLGANLNFYLEDSKTAKEVLSHLGDDHSFVSLSGKKDLIMQKTKTPLPLLHLARSDKGDSGLRPDHLHMWCAPVGSTLELRMNKLALNPKARGQIYHHGMNNTDWSLLQTHEL